MGKLLIVDGMNLLCQMFFGMPSRIVNGDGKAIQGILGFVGALIRIIKMANPTHVVVLFDGEHENERAKLLPEYKVNRPDFSEIPESESPFSPIADVYRALDYMGIVHAEIETHEADDVISSYALTYGGEMEIVIVSMDSDFFQLINGNVSVLRYRGDKTYICDSEYISARYGILPEQYADFKSLMGDSSDNIRGAAKVGPKTAAALINQFGSLRGVVGNAGDIAKPSIRESVLSCRERLINNYRLIKLDDRAEIPFILDELRYTYSGVITGEVLKEIKIR